MNNAMNRQQRETVRRKEYDRWNTDREQAKADSRLKRERESMFAALADQRGFYDQPGLATDLQGEIMAALSGERGPFTADVVNDLNAQLADTGAGAFRAGREAIERRGANAGVKVGGALFDLQNSISANTRRGLSEIKSRQAIQNAARQERAIADAMRLMQEKAQNNWNARQAEADYRSRMYATMQQQQQQAAAPAVAAPRSGPAMPTFGGSLSAQQRAMELWDKGGMRGGFAAGNQPFEGYRDGRHYTGGYRDEPLSYRKPAEKWIPQYGATGYGGSAATRNSYQNAPQQAWQAGKQLKNAASGPWF